MFLEQGLLVEHGSARIAHPGLGPQVQALYVPSAVGSLVGAEFADWTVPDSVDLGRIVVSEIGRLKVENYSLQTLLLVALKENIP